MSGNRITDEELAVMIHDGTLTAGEARSLHGATYEAVADFLEEKLQRKLEGWDRS